VARTFRRRRGGRVAVRLSPEEVELLRMIARDVVTIVCAPPEGEVGERLYPRAYLDPTEERAEQDFRGLVHDDLVEQRRSALATVLDKLPPTDPTVEVGAGERADFELDADEALQWLTALNDARLVIGTALGVTEDDNGDFPPDDPRFYLGTCYQWLSYLQFELVELLLDDLGEDGVDDA